MRKSLLSVLVALSIAASAAHAQTTPEYAELMDLEAQFEAAHLAHIQDGGNPDDLIAALDGLLEAVTEEDIKAFAEGRLDAIAPYALPRLQQARSRIEIWSQRQEEVQEAYDLLSQAKSEYFIDHAFNYIHLAMGDAQRRLPETAVEGLRTHYLEARESYNMFKLNRAMYGTGKDFLRLTGYKDFFTHSAQFMEAMQQAYSGASGGPGLWERLTRNVGLGARFMVHGMPTLFRAAAAWVLPVFPAFFDRAYRYTNRFFMRLARVLGHTVDVDMPHGPLPANGPDTINVYAPNHADWTFDLMTAGTVIGELAPDAFAFSARHAQPGFFRPFIAKNHAIISVGSGKKPVDEILNRLPTSDRRSILIYPEGSLPLGMGETRPVRDKFSTEFIARLRQGGYKVNLIPLTSFDSYRFINAHRFFGPNEPGQETLQLKVHRAISSKAIDMLLTSPLALNRVVRAQWLQNLQTNSTRLAGTFRVTEVFRRIREFVANRLPGAAPASCHTYLEQLDADAASASARTSIMPAARR